MKKIKTLFLIFILCLSVAKVNATDNLKSITVLFTHDTHSYIKAFAKIKTYYDQNKNIKPTYLVDAGDFSMGTAVQTIYTTESSELNMLQKTGFDITTIGNHEFDYRTLGLASMLDNITPDTMKFVVSNIDWDTTLNDIELEKNAKVLKQSFSDFGIKEYTVIEKEGIRIGFFSIFGKSSDEYAPESGVKFLDQIETAKKMVNILQTQNVDYIVCLSHSGTDKDATKSEDEILAKSVDGIDLIVSGHTHTYLYEPIIVNDTYIVSCGQFNDNLGRIDLSIVDNKVNLDDYKLIPLDSNIEDDEEILNLANNYFELANKNYFNQYGFNLDDVLIENDIEFTSADNFGQIQKEDTLGNIVADSYIYAINQFDSEKVDVAIAPSGVIRSSLPKGKIYTENAFNVLSLGMGKDLMAGYPLVSAYLSGKELKLISEVDISISPLMTPARLYFSGLSFKYNNYRMILNKTYDVVLDNRAFKYITNNSELNDIETIDDNKLYRVVADLYSVQMLSTVNDLSKSILSLVPKDKNGNPIENFEDHIVYYTENGQQKELKQWYAFSTYLKSFDTKIDDYYATTSNRKIENKSLNPLIIFSQLNTISIIIYSVIVFVVLLLVLIVRFAIKFIKKRKYNN